MASGAFRKQKSKLLPLAILNYKTSNHTNLWCKTSKFFNSIDPYNNLDHILGLKFDPNLSVTTNFADELLRRKQILLGKTKQKRHAVIYKMEKFYATKQELRHSKRKTTVTISHRIWITKAQKIFSMTSDSSVPKNLKKFCPTKDK